MRFFAVATDYDNTLASNGRVGDAAWAALDRLRASGRQAILVSGRELDDLLNICPRLDVFSRVVAENGGVLYDPSSGERRLLAPAPPPRFAEELRKRGLRDFSVSETLVAMMRPNEQTALAAIRDLGLELQIVFNGDAVMIVAPGVSKASGLQAALNDLALSPFNVVAIGDAENDHALLAACGFPVAVANALPALKEHAVWVTRQAAGAGVAELVDALVADDLRSHASPAMRNQVTLGRRRDAPDEAPLGFPAHGTMALLVGESGCGKSTATAGLLERLTAAGCQLCIIDPEGDYGGDDSIIAVGDAHTAPPLDEVLQLLRRPGVPVVAANLLRVPLDERPGFCAALLLHIQQLRLQTGRPHWLVFEEAHHLFPADWAGVAQTIPEALETALAITVSPDQVSPAFLRQVNTVLAMGRDARAALAQFAAAVDRPAPTSAALPSKPGEALFWRVDDEAQPPCVVLLEPGNEHRRRHRRKYAEGMLIPERSFYFRGPQGALNLRAHNLILFLEIAEGVDPATWQFHLERGDYSRWFENEIGDAELAQEARQIEQDRHLSPAESLDLIRAAVQARYTQPENPSLPAILSSSTQTGQAAGENTQTRR